MTETLDPTLDLVLERELAAPRALMGDAEAVSAVRAVRKSAPFTNLPPDKYDAWSEVVVNFDPSELM